MATQYPITINNKAFPPGPSGYWVVGALPMLLSNPIKFLTDTANTYGDLISFKIGPQRVYLLNHPDHLKHVLQTHYRNYHKGLNLVAAKRLVGQGVATSEGDAWMHQHRMIQPAFHLQKVAAMATAVTDATTILLQRWQTLADRGDVFDVSEELMHTTQEIIVKTMFSSTIGDAAQTISRALNDAIIYLGRSMFTSMLPNWLTPGHRRFEEALRMLDSVVYGFINERRRSGEDRDDLLTMLLQARDAETGEGMSDQQIRDEVMTIFIAGHETTATTLAWTWHALAQHPDVERRLHMELDTVLGGRTPTFHDLPQLTYTKMVIEESLRLYPATWALFRTPVADDTIAGYRIPKGSLVLPSPYTIHHNHSFWPDPERFDPERFNLQQSTKRQAYTYIPFGSGPRQCIGRTFALMEAQLMVAMVAQRYRLVSVPGHPVEPSIAFTLRARHGIRMTLEPRPPLA